jgi:hypothetical protein
MIGAGEYRGTSSWDVVFLVNFLQKAVMYTPFPHVWQGGSSVGTHI